jgi:predicted kinase
MKTCYLMVGLPASGKSTFVESMKTQNTFVYSTDSYLDNKATELGLVYDDVFADYIDEATQNMNRGVDVAIRENRNIIWDQTNLGVKKRSKIIRRMTNAKYDVCCICFDIPKASSDFFEWERRLKNRPGKTIPPFILENMIDTYVEPSIEEGYSGVRMYNIYGKLQKETSS